MFELFLCVCKRWNEISKDKFLNKTRVRMQNGDVITRIIYHLTILPSMYRETTIN